MWIKKKQTTQSSMVWNFFLKSEWKWHHRCILENVRKHKTYLSNEHTVYCFELKIVKTSQRNLWLTETLARRISRVYSNEKRETYLQCLFQFVKHFTRPNLILTHSRTFRPAAVAVAAETCEPNIVQLLPVTFAASFGFFPVKFHFQFWISSYFVPLDKPD